MARYLETAGKLRDLIEAFVAQHNLDNSAVAKIGEMVNLAVRCAPRGVQHTVRQNIVKTAVGRHCHVSMREVQGDRGSFHAIEIIPIGLTAAEVEAAKKAIAQQIGEDDADTD